MSLQDPEEMHGDISQRLNLGAEAVWGAAERKDADASFFHP